MLLFIDMSIYWYIKWEKNILIRLAKLYICLKICEFTQVKGVVCKKKKMPIGTRMPCYKNVSRVVLLVLLQGLCFYVCKRNNMIWISRHEKTAKQLYYFFLFIRSGLYSCRKVTFIVSVISREKSWTMNAKSCLILIFLLWPFYFQ